MKTLILALLFTTFLGTVFAASNDPISTESIALQVSGEILDTDMGLKPNKGADPLWFAITKLDLRAQQITVEGSEPLKPIFIHAMNRLTRKASVRLQKEAIEDSTLQDIFKAHRKVSGFGVHGPFKFQGRVILTFEVYEKGVSMFMVMEPKNVSGPNGGWNK